MERFEDGRALRASIGGTSSRDSGKLGAGTSQTDTKEGGVKLKVSELVNFLSKLIFYSKNGTIENYELARQLRLIIGTIQNGEPFELEDDRLFDIKHANNALIEFVDSFLREMEVNGEFDEGCFYYEKKSSPGLQLLIEQGSKLMSKYLGFKTRIGKEFFDNNTDLSTGKTTSDRHTKPSQ